MGCSLSCQTFEKVSGSLQWVLLDHFMVSGATHILADFISVGLCQCGLDCFFTLANDIHLPIKHAKTVLPTTCCSVHGVEIDTTALDKITSG